ncbi:MAG TPA: hypothetical protein VNE71_09475, partial [Myxococcota bacterium]|nr:hypothetical protein [Myxococcota bacterium]
TAARVAPAPSAGSRATPRRAALTPLEGSPAAIERLAAAPGAVRLRRADARLLRAKLELGDPAVAGYEFSVD